MLKIKRVTLEKDPVINIAMYVDRQIFVYVLV